MTATFHHPWLTKSAAPHGSFTGVSFGKYFINGQQVSKEAYAASKQGQQATIASNRAPKPKRSRRTIQDAAIALHKLGYELGRPSHDVHTGVTSYGVKTPDGRQTTLTADQLDNLIGGKGKAKPAKRSAARPSAAAARSATPPLPQKPSSDPRHNPDLDAAFGEPTQAAKPAAGPIRGANPDLDAFMGVGEGINAKQPPKPSAAPEPVAAAKQVIAKIGRIPPNADPQAVLGFLKQQVAKLPPPAQQALAEAAGLFLEDTPEAVIAKIRKVTGPQGESKTAQAATPTAGTNTKPSVGGASHKLDFSGAFTSGPKATDTYSQHVADSIGKTGDVPATERNNGKPTHLAQAWDMVKGQNLHNHPEAAKRFQEVIKNAYSLQSAGRTAAQAWSESLKKHFGDLIGGKGSSTKPSALPVARFAQHDNPREDRTTRGTPPPLPKREGVGVEAASSYYDKLKKDPAKMRQVVDRWKATAHGNQDIIQWLAFNPKSPVQGEAVTRKPYPTGTHVRGNQVRLKRPVAKAWHPWLMKGNQCPI